MRKLIAAAVIALVLNYLGHLLFFSHHYRVMAKQYGRAEVLLGPLSDPEKLRYAMLRDKYNWAAAHPWLRVPPDPPDPSGPPFVARPFKF